MQKKPEFKLFIILFICTAFIFSFSHFGASAYNNVRTNSGGFGAGTIIGPIDVSGKSKDEALELLTESLKKWRSDTTIHLQYKEKSIPIDVTGFNFDLENSVEMAKEGQQNEIIVTYKSGELYQYLQNLSSELNQSTVKIDPLLSELIGYGTIFQNGEHYVKVEKHLTIALNEHDAISSALITPEYIPLELGLLVKELSPIKVKAKSQVSLLKLLEQRQFTTFPADASTMIASVIYETIMASNFTIVEKHTSQILPEYVKLGLEAKVDNANHLDFIFTNPNESNYEITLQLEGNTLTAYLKGSTFLNHYVLKLADKKEYKPKTIVQYSPLLSPGEVKVEQTGSNGVTIKVFRQTYGEKEEWLRDELISEDYYPPLHRIEIHGLKSTGTTDGTGTTDQGNVSPDDGSTSEQTPALPTTPNPWGTEDDNLFGKPNETTK
ncbi:VanW family protein [Bacillus sp. T3]|uniref:VanW family protein n=1 Tax=Bacillus sp. T3 TaxID=467262 RepID=UPI0029814F0D|nr:VanW family protein [Bacillus sp. T3]